MSNCIVDEHPSDKMFDKWVSESGVYKTVSTGGRSCRVGTNWKAVARKAYQHGVTRSALDCITKIAEDEDTRLRAVGSLRSILDRFRDPSLQGDAMDAAYDDIFEALGEERMFGTESVELDP